MKRTLGSIGAVAALLALLSVAFVALQASAAPKHMPAIKHRGGAITIKRWLHAATSTNMNTGTTWACFKVTGAIKDQGGGPLWYDETSFENGAPTLTQDTVCSDEEPIGGFTIVPAPAGSNLASVTATHTMTGRWGQFVITMAGDYNLSGNPGTGFYGTIAPWHGAGTWVITSGAGAYEGMQGNGTWTADLTLFGTGIPYCNHTETGQVWWTK